MGCVYLMKDENSVIFSKYLSVGSREVEDCGHYILM